MNKKLIGTTILYLILATITITATVFAWLQINKQTSGFIGTNVPDFSDMISFYVHRSDDSERILIDSIEDMREAFGVTRPGESYEFTMYVTNELSYNFLVSIFVPEIKSMYAIPDEPNNPDSSVYNILDVFYINDGTVYTNGMPHLLTTDNNYFLSNLVTVNDGLTLLEGYQLLMGDTIEVKFTLTYDATFNDSNYQYFMLAMSGIYIYVER